LEKERLDAEADAMAKALADAKPRIGYIGRGVANGAARLHVLDPADQERALALLRKMNQPAPTVALGGAAEPDFQISVAPDGYIEARLTRTGVEKQASDAVTRSIEVIRRRIDAMGTSEVSIVRQGADRINVQAPGVSDPEALKRSIGKTAKMTFHLVDPTVTPQDLAAGRAPPGTEILPQDDPAEPLVAVKSRVLLSGDDLADAQPTFDQSRGGGPVVSFRFNQRGARIFCQITSENSGQRFATVLDGKVITAPRIHEPICGGQGQIYGGFTVETANELSVLLRAGALPAPLTVVEQRTVGAELGQDAISSGVTAGIVASIAVVGFMVLAYGLFGVLACVALVINIAMIIAAMSLGGATLSLPGIAGLILTIGMAVDANVLIYERMREEQANGRGAVMSIDAGFSRALVTIIDSHLTQIGVALILFQFGHGPVRGFAWTLSIGVVTSVFTATLVTQLFIAMWFRAVRPKKLPI
jgi:protein-export membrane protein SecD